MKKYAFIGFVMLALALSMYQVSYAETVIVNNVSSSASTGGNSASNGEVVEGTSQSSVFIETVVNGEVVEYVNKEVVSDEGSVSVTVESNVISNSGEGSHVETNIGMVAGEENVVLTSEPVLETENNLENPIKRVLQAVRNETSQDFEEESDEVVNGSEDGGDEGSLDDYSKTTIVVKFLAKIIKYVFSIFTA